MLLAIPLPAIVFNQLTLPLQLLASSVASAILPLAGVPVLREGNIIQLPTMQLEVAEACSGIRSLLSLFTCAVIFGYLAETHLSRRGQRDTDRRYGRLCAVLESGEGARLLS